MRFLTSFHDERKAYACVNYLNEQGIGSMYEASNKVYSIWVIEEDDFEKAKVIVEKFIVLDPDELVRLEKPKLTAMSKMTQRGKEPQLRVRLQTMVSSPRIPHPLTHLLIALCVILFLWNSFQQATLLRREGPVVVEMGLTPLQKILLFDDPQCYDALREVLKKYPVQSLSDLDQLPVDVQQVYAAAERCPTWKGVVDILMGEGSFGAPMFEKLRRGEIWRLITPTFLHRDFLHILFNMAWLLILGKMIEQRAGKLRMIFLVLVIGSISNVAQYLMGGPYFLGFSGVIVGMAGFIWMRQKASPWEGYPLSRGTLLFLFLFVAAMLVLDAVSFFFQLFGVQGIVGNIANTAHIAGGITGIVLGRIHLFSRSP